MRVFVLVTLVSILPYLHATLAPPPGRTFVGAFHWLDDVFYYLSFAQQAENGHLLFANKLVTTPHRPALVNLEWGATGLLSRALGRNPALAFRVVGVVATFFLLLALDRWLVFGGLPASHRVAALLLIATGGGIGGLLFELTPLPASRTVDLSAGLYPFLAILFQPHWASATALLLWALWVQTVGRGRRGLVGSAVLCTALALTRPYDLALLLGIRGAAIAFEPPASWWSSAARLATAAPGLAYTAWVFLFRPEFGSFSSAVFSRFVYPPLDLAVALAPPALLAALAFRRGCWPAAVRPFQLWIVIVAVVLWLRPLSLPNQFVVGWGLPVLLLLALALGRHRPVFTAAAAAALCVSCLVSVRIAWRGDPHWLVPTERLAAARAFRESCRGGGVFVGPVDIGSYVNAFTGCRAWVAHHAGPDYGNRLAALGRFYGDARPADRAALLDEACATHLALPFGPDVRSWIAPTAGFQPAFVAGSGPSAILLAVRPRPSHCPTL